MVLQWLPTPYLSHMVTCDKLGIVFVTPEHALFDELQTLDGIENRNTPIEGQWYKTSMSMLHEAYDKHVILRASV